MKRMRLITPETLRISRGERERPKDRGTHSFLGGLVIGSAEGIHFAYTAVQLPKAVLPEAKLAPKQALSPEPPEQDT